SALLLVALLLAPARAEEQKKLADDDVQDVVFLADSRPLLIRLHIRLDDRPFRTAWEGFINELFDKLDTNKDGVLDRAEAARIPPPQEIFSAQQFFGGFGGGIGGFRNSADSDGDGKVTRQEFADYYRKNGGAPFQLAAGGQNQQFFRQPVNLARQPAG